MRFRSLDSRSGSLPKQICWLGHKWSPLLCWSPHCRGLCTPCRPRGTSEATGTERLDLDNGCNPPRSDLPHTHALKNCTGQPWLLHIQKTKGRCRTYQQTHWNGSQCRRPDNCTQHTRSQWTLHFLQREEVFFRQRHRERGQNDVADCSFWLLGKPRIFIPC